MTMSTEETPQQQLWANLVLAILAYGTASKNGEDVGEEEDLYDYIKACIREAKIEGVKDAVCELEVWDDSCPDSMRAACQEDAEENEVCVACWLDAIESGDWPPKE